MLDQLRPGDVVVVWKLDRLSRSLKDLLLIMETIDQADAQMARLYDVSEATISRIVTPRRLGEITDPKMRVGR